MVGLDGTATPSGTPGKIRPWNVHSGRPADDVFFYSTHVFGVREAVELARAMNCLPQTLLIYGIEGKQFCFGTSPSPEVEQGVESVAQQLLELARTTMGPAHKTMSL